MSIELALCLVFLLASLPICIWLSIHFAIFAAINVAFIGIVQADSSILSMVFVTLTVADLLLFMRSGRSVLLLSAAVSAALAIESMLNMDWLLSHSTYLSAAVNSVFAGVLIKGYWNWTHGK